MAACGPTRAFRAREPRVAHGECGAKVRVAVDGGFGRRMLGRLDRMGSAVDSEGGCWMVGQVMIWGRQNLGRYLSTPMLARRSSDLGRQRQLLALLLLQNSSKSHAVN